MEILEIKIMVKGASLLGKRMKNVFDSLIKHSQHN